MSSNHNRRGIWRDLRTLLRAALRPGAPDDRRIHLQVWAGGVMGSRAPDQIIGGADAPYMRRWFVIPRNRLFNVYLHHFLRSDDDRALHDHPWFNLSILLAGSYVEHTIDAGGVHRRAIRRAGDWKARRAASAHRIELHDGPCVTLFLTGPRLRAWGFHCPAGWRHWKIFTDPTDSGKIGRGCGEGES